MEKSLHGFLIEPQHTLRRPSYVHVAVLADSGVDLLAAVLSEAVDEGEGESDVERVASVGAGVAFACLEPHHQIDVRSW